MVPLPAVGSAPLALDPVEALRGEHSQLEAWVRDSFAALESMHAELSDWQRDVTRQQAELDQRQASIAEAEARDSHEARDFAALQQKLTQTQEEFRQLEEENAEQLHALDEMERQLVVAQTEIRVVRKHADDMAIALEAERERTVDERHMWAGELREMRRTLQRQGHMLVSLGATAPAADEPDQEGATALRCMPADAPDGESAPGDAAARAAELRRRATSRRANRRTH